MSVFTKLRFSITRAMFVGCDWMKFRSILSVSIFGGPMFVAIIMIDASVNVNFSWALNFKAHLLRVIERSS